MCKKPGMVFSSKFPSPTKVMPIVVARIEEEGSIIWACVICAMSLVFKQYVDTFPHNPLCIFAEGQEQAPFFLGYNLTIYVAGK